MSSQRILIVEDDPRLAAMVADYLGGAGFRADVAGDGAAALKALGGPSAEPFDALVLDLMLPDIDGLEVCRRLRADPAHAGLPVLMLTARGDATDRVVGLELGADDYLPKPFERRELVARVKAILRRGGKVGPAGKRRLGGFIVDRGRRGLFDDSETSLPLTSGEFDLFCCFVDRPGRVLSRDQLMDWTRGRVSDTLDRNIDVQMSRLRKKLIEAGFPEDGIKTVRNVGYILTLPVDDVS